MKNKFSILFVLILFSLFSVQCKKISTPDEDSKALFGTWQYFDNNGVSGGVSGIGGFTSENWVIFDEKGNYKEYKGSSKVQKFRFTIESRTGTYKYAIVFKNNKSATLLYKVESDTLFLNEESADGFGYQFVRK